MVIGNSGFRFRRDRNSRNRRGRGFDAGVINLQQDEVWGEVFGVFGDESREIRGELLPC